MLGFIYRNTSVFKSTESLKIAPLFGPFFMMCMYVALIEPVKSTLKQRRSLSCIIFLYKLIQGQIVNTNLLSEMAFHVWSVLDSRYRLAFIPSYNRTNQHLNCALNNTCRIYNSISSDADIIVSDVNMLMNNQWLQKYVLT